MEKNKPNSDKDVIKQYKNINDTDVVGTGINNTSDVKIRSKSSLTKRPLVLLICEEHTIYKKRDYAEELARELSEYCDILPIERSLSDAGEALIKYKCDIVIASHMVNDVDAIIALANLRKSRYYADSLLVLLCNRITKAIENVCSTNRIDAAYSFTANVKRTAMDIVARYELYSIDAHAIRMNRIMYAENCIEMLSDVEGHRLDCAGTIDEVMMQLGVDNRLSGSHYIKLIIELRLGGMDGSMSDMYEYVAVYAETGKSAVEKAVRYAIEQTWLKGNIYIQHKLFGNTMDEARGKPTNAEFIATLANYVRSKLTRNILIFN